jgi:NitT/TauT family transport system ATP-binding protein
MQKSSDIIDIRVRNLSKEFVTGRGVLKVIDDLSFDVRRGGLVALIGPSGCGKSTLLRILADSDQVTTGEYTIDNERGSRMASIEQRPALFPWRTALQNASLGAEVRRGIVSRAVDRRIRENFISFGLKGFEESYPVQLSGGMQQRVAIIRALESEPHVLFCDEPFSAIDFVTRLSLNTQFKRISRELGCTTLFVTHNIEEAIFLGSRIIVLSRRPCVIVDDFEPHLSQFPEDAVKCRQSPEFSGYFARIWERLAA